MFEPTFRKFATKNGFGGFCFIKLSFFYAISFFVMFFLMNAADSHTHQNVSIFERLHKTQKFR